MGNTNEIHAKLPNLNTELKRTVKAKKFFF